jgi:predicted peroxiredoxin
MAQILFVATHATEDPNRATFPFLMARGAVENGDQPEILLMGEATNLVRPGVLESIVAAGPPPLREIYPDVAAASVPLWV